MSKKTVTVNVDDLPRHRPLPVMEKPVKPGNGKATYKTATAAANASVAARDEAKASEQACRGYAVVSENSEKLCELYTASAHRYYCRTTWLLIGVVMALVAHIVFVCWT